MVAGHNTIFNYKIVAKCGLNSMHFYKGSTVIMRTKLGYWNLYIYANVYGN